jgi:hypothetical protein
MRALEIRLRRLEEQFGGTVVPRADARGRRSLGPAMAPLKLRFGDLRRLPENYRGERHVVIAKRLPERAGQEWVEFEEVPGPAPSLPSQEPRELLCFSR